MFEMPVCVVVTAPPTASNPSYGAWTTFYPDLMNDEETLTAVLPAVWQDLSVEIEANSDCPRRFWEWKAVESKSDFFSEVPEVDET